METRRKFVQKGLLGIAAAGLAGGAFASTKQGKEAVSRTAKGFDFNLAIAGYSFVKFGLDDALAMMKRMDVRYLCIKDFHLPLTSTDAEIAAFHQKLADSGVTGYGVGPIYMTKSKEEIDAGFEYAKRVGVKLMVGIPSQENLPYISEKVKEYDIQYAIHNHGPEDKLYPNATTVYEAVKNLDERMGLCFDMGHNARDGQDSIKDLERYHHRIFDVHFKNVTAPTKDGKTCELGRGVIDIPRFVETLRKVGYQGKCSLEFEKDMNDPLAGLAECKGYFQGVIDSLS